ncbi:gamma-glutamylcyclotransferase [Sulfitobacter sp. F26169L]|uniref:gamma-glutamylcyclotransferase family protein n=1 Tax=Sulfitobacter sp. F26169L TaxID=2996015 RepID=UPI0022610164|nr:gamma-glutamylcyclotransferase family protein [Sulfitobacter sp. F26169L]MCX7567823.1 gamma-glutamylcyclotransferase [Sulfitobacter sp. F26169L]
MHPCFFGYGSLVNRATHTYAEASRARLDGWRRKWVYTQERGLAFLSVIPDATTSIDGLIADVPNADWDALDAREYGYARIVSGPAVQHPRDPATQISHYAVPKDTWMQGSDSYILLSYLDVVVQGYLREYGAGGVTDFFATTDGWDTPILNDRAQPRYPRDQKLSAQETTLVDQHLALRSARIVAT